MIHTHEQALDALCGCAATVSVLSYQEVIEGYFKLRGLPIPPDAVPPPAEAPPLTVEEVAIKVYEAMRWAADPIDPDNLPAWVPGGNSQMQDHARQAAQAIVRMAEKGGAG